MHTESIPTMVLDRVERALKSSYHAAAAVQGNLDEPYSDDPRWTPRARWLNPAAKRAYEARQILREARGIVDSSKEQEE